MIDSGIKGFVLFQNFKAATAAPLTIPQVHHLKQAFRKQGFSATVDEGH